MASRAAATARSRIGAASAARPLSFKWIAQAAQVPRVLRPSIRQVAEDRLGLGAAAHPLEQVGQLVGRLGAEGAGRRVVPHRLLAGRRPQLVQGPGQGVVDPDVAGVAAGGGAEQGHGRLGLADVRQGPAQQDGRGRRQLGRLGGGGQGLQRLGLAACGPRPGGSCGGDRDTAPGRPAAPPPAASARRRPAASPRGARPTSRRGRPTARSPPPRAAASAAGRTRRARGRRGPAPRRGRRRRRRRRCRRRRRPA